MIRLPRVTVESQARRRAEATARVTFAQGGDDATSASAAAGGAQDAPVAKAGTHGAPVPHATPGTDLASCVTSLASAAAQLASLAQQLAGQLGSAAGSSPTDLALLAPPEPCQSSVNPLLDQHDLAAYLRVTERTLRRMRHDGRVPEPMQFGTQPRWRRVDIEDWLASEAHPRRQPGRTRA